MTQAYSNPDRADDSYALPDVEVFWCGAPGPEGEPPGWFWQACFPGCLPDGAPNGPFATEAEALADAQSACDDYECDDYVFSLVAL